MQNIKTNLFAALAAVFMTAVLAAPIATGEGSGVAPTFTVATTVALA